jgi:hypothetical protein
MLFVSSCPALSRHDVESGKPCKREPCRRKAFTRCDLARAILEWSDPLGLRGCGFFRIVDEKIAFQRGYWDKLSFLRLHGLPLPTR